MLEDGRGAAALIMRGGGEAAPSSRGAADRDLEHERTMLRRQAD